MELALREVPEPFRTTLILRDIEGFVYEEVAAMQGVNLGTVKSRLVRGRAFLKASLTASRSTAPAGNEDVLERGGAMNGCNEVRSGLTEYLDGRLDRTRDAGDRRTPPGLPRLCAGVGVDARIAGFAG